MKSKQLRLGLGALLSVAALGVSGCGDATTHTDATSGAQAAGSTEARAIARLEPTQGNNARGTVRFSSEANGVRVVGEITGLTPGEHGFHVHETGDCSAPDASSAGGHYNPTKQPHAGRDNEARHIGDLGNITADANGRAQFDYLDTKLALSGPNSIVGRSVIVHAGRDDLKSQPSGDAGGRVACGAIEMER